MNLRDLDLNLLVVLERLLAERSVSGAAGALGLTQPAVSNALRRLRNALGDDLLVRTPRGMEPTPFARALAEPLNGALATLAGALERRDSFDPATSRRAFRIAMTDIGEIYFMPVLVRTLAEAAPGVTVSTVRGSAAALKEEMIDGSVDLAVGLLPELKAGFFQRRLFTQRYVCLMRRGHPLARRPLTVERFAAAEHVMVVSQGTGHGAVDELMQRQGIARRVRLTVPHFVAVGHIVAASDLLATVPEKLAARLVAPFGLVSQPHPVPLPPITLHLFWHSLRHREAGNRWLRQRFIDAFAED